jgi:hypothetical protein
VRAGGPVLGSRLRRWRVGEAGGGHPGEFLARLWSAFGPPDEAGAEGFTYWLRDRETDVELTAYLGPGGSAYGAEPSHAESVLEVLPALDDLLDGMPLADCEIAYVDESGPRRCGARDGVPFDEAATAGDGPRTRATAERLRALLNSPSADPFDLHNVLVELAAAWRTGEPAPAEAALARRGLETAVTRMEELVEEIDAAGSGARRSDAEIVADVVVPQLADVAARLGVDVESIRARLDAIESRAGAVARRPDPPT